MLQNETLWVFQDTVIIDEVSKVSEGQINELNVKNTFFLLRPSCHFSTRGNVSREMFTVSGPTFFILLLDKNMTVKLVKIVKQQTFLSMTHKRKKLQVLEPQKRDISEYFSTLSTSAEKPWWPYFTTHVAYKSVELFRVLENWGSSLQYNCVH